MKQSNSLIRNIEENIFLDNFGNGPVNVISSLIACLMMFSGLIGISGIKTEYLQLNEINNYNFLQINIAIVSFVIALRSNRWAILCGILCILVSALFFYQFLVTLRGFISNISSNEIKQSIINSLLEENELIFINNLIAFPALSLLYTLTSILNFYPHKMPFIRKSA